MAQTCAWCESEKVTSSKNSVFWELPDGSRAIEIRQTPSITCHSCEMEYQTENTVKVIEDQLFLINTNAVGNEISYEDLMAQPRLLKRNYFDFSSYPGQE
ncbi:YokU family protein [Cytobacillus purgationiresistens]|uniref:YokU family protein n=1 Tax=Cytobacillus purgationiresistens TaxID=863449 RepID=A0ABU0AL38_9BACI|nr:putative YokU family protein [Cytobacillus purgationiresistens]